MCALHFKDEDVEYHPFSRKYTLVKGAIPSVFQCWDDVYQVREKTPRKQNKMQMMREIVQATPPELPEPNCEKENEIELTSFIQKCSQLEKENREISTKYNELLKQHKSVSTENAALQSLISQQNTKIQEASITNAQLQEKIKDNQFSVDNIPDSSFQFYTGFPSRAVFDQLLSFLNPGENGENVVMVRGTVKSEEKMNSKKIGRPRKLSPKIQFFLFLCRVRVGLFEEDLAHRFKMSVASVSNLVISWANFIYLRLGSLNIWPSKEMVQQSMPQSFRDSYPSTRVIIDASEIKVEMPSSLVLQSQTYSNYKSTNTLKGLVGISPAGHITFISQLYTGSISDRELTERSGILNLPFEDDDSVMADKGFDIKDLLDDMGVQLNIPPFLGNKQSQMPAADVELTQKIARERIHVERAINKIKKFHIFNCPIPLSLAGSINQIWTVCGLLTLFQNPIISS